MTTEDLEKLLDGEKPTPAPALEVKKTPEEIKAEEALKKEEQLANLNKAIAEANQRLADTRKAAKSAKEKPTEEELPKIDFTDPSSKAWDKHIRENVNPVQEELDNEKKEIRSFALQEFLSDKPLLAKNPDQLKKLMDTYEKIRTCSERTREGIILDLKRAYAAENAEELFSASQSERIDEARGNAIFSDIAVSRGSTSIPKEKAKVPHLDKSDEAILAKWGMTPAEWIEQDTKQKQKKS